MEFSSVELKHCTLIRLGGRIDGSVAPELGSGWLTQPIWFYLIAAAWLLAAVEWLLYQRRWIT